MQQLAYRFRSTGLIVAILVLMLAGVSHGQWSQDGKFTVVDGVVEDYSGWSVSVSGDRIVVGTIYDDDMGKNSGSAQYMRGMGAIGHSKLNLPPPMERLMTVLVVRSRCRGIVLSSVRMRMTIKAMFRAQHMCMRGMGAVGCSKPS